MGREGWREGGRARTFVGDFDGLVQVRGHKCVSESHVERRADLGLGAPDEVEEAGGGREGGREGGRKGEGSASCFRRE